MRFYSGQSLFFSMRIFKAFVFLFLVIPVFGQEPATIENLKKQKEARQEVAQRSIMELKKGVLLVRIDMQRRKVDYYLENGNTREAEKIRKKTQAEGMAIIDAFRTYYTFGTVYFFEMEDSRKLLEGRMNEIIFYNDSAQPDPSIHPDPDLPKFVAEFGFVEQDTTMYLSSSTPDTGDPENPEGKTYYGGSKNNKPALVIRDAQFQQLRDPFPFYVGYSYFGSINKRYRLPVMRWQDDLDRYYEKVVMNGN